MTIIITSAEKRKEHMNAKGGKEKLPVLKHKGVKLYIYTTKHRNKQTKTVG